MKLLYYIRRFCEITRTEKILFIKGAVFSGFFRFVTIIFPIKYYLHFFKNPRFESTDSEKMKNYIHLVNKTLKRVVRCMPWKCNCLVQATTNKMLLNIFKIPSCIVLTIHKKENKELIAHATIRVSDFNDSLKSSICLKIDK
jgi:hypothetical protein